MEFLLRLLSTWLALTVVQCFAGFPIHYKPLQVEYIYAQCDLVPGTDSKVSGIVRLRQAVGGYNAIYNLLEVDLSVTGLNGTDKIKEHGFHVHTYGDTGDKCSAAGGHYNPTGTDHGSPNDEPGKRHIGDWGNVPEDSLNPSIIRYRFTDYLSSLTGEYSIIGRGIVLHEKADDLGRGGNAGSKANGNAGSRLACCVIRIVKGWD